MNFSTFNLLPLLTLFLMSQVQDVNAGLLGCIGYPVCQSACNAAWVTCLSTLGLTAGTLTGGAGAPVAVLACSGAQGACMAACAAAALSPV